MNKAHTCTYVRCENSVSFRAKSQFGGSNANGGFASSIDSLRVARWANFGQSSDVLRASGNPGVDTMITTTDNF